jgi:ribonuclease HII
MMVTEDRWVFEKRLWAAGHSLVAGVDEAGRGPLAGPVVAAAVILPKDFRHDDVRDSKLLTAAKREKMARLIEKVSLAWATAQASDREIEEINILQATFLAMRRALEKLSLPPTYVLVDHVTVPGLAVPQQPITGGDRLSASIAAASIIAKVRRDGIMEEWHRRFPRYNFAKNKGYGTAEHRQAIRDHGPCPIHRRTFKGVREYI